MTTPPTAYPWEDLPEWEARFNRAIANFVESLHRYDTYGGPFKDEVVERLRRLADPPGIFPDDSVQAARELEAALKRFRTVQFLLTSKLTTIKIATGMAANALQLRFLSSLMHVTFSLGENPLDAVEQYQADLRNAIEQSSQEVSDIARLVLGLAMSAFDAAADVIQLRIIFLRTFLDATDPPRSVPGVDDKTYAIITRDAAANEALLTAGELALDRLRIEWARHIPLATILASLASFVLDVRKELKHLQDKRALWQQTIDAPYHRNTGDEARVGATRIREDDEAIERLLESLNGTFEKLMELAQVL